MEIVVPNGGDGWDWGCVGIVDGCAGVAIRQMLTYHHGVVLS